MTGIKMTNDNVKSTVRNTNRPNGTVKNTNGKSNNHRNGRYKNSNGHKHSNQYKAHTNSHKSSGLESNGNHKPLREGFFEKFALKLTKFSGSTPAFIGAFSIVIAWAIAGPIFGFTETWQLIINTCTTIVTFLMVFLIQRAQNKESLSVQLKLNEIIASINGASNRLIDIEDMSEHELEALKRHYIKLAKLFKEEESIKESHSIEEAEKRHKTKVKRRRTS